MSGPVIMLVGGGGMIAFLVYDWMQYKMRLRMRRSRDDVGKSKWVSYDWKVYAMIVVTIIVAYLYGRGIDRLVGEEIPGIEPTFVRTHSYVVALYITIVGIWWTIRRAGAEKLTRKMLITGQVADLVHSFKSVFRIRPTVFNALEEANRKIEPPVGGAIAHAVTTFYVTSLPQRAYAELRERVDDPYMDQFVYILERGDDAKHEDIMVALEGLQARMRRARELRDQSEVNMTVITGQSRIIQIIAVAVVAVVGAVPLFRVAYENVIGQTIFLVIATVGVLTSAYIDRKAQALKEKVL